MAKRLVLLLVFAGLALGCGHSGPGDPGPDADGDAADAVDTGTDPSSDPEVEEDPFAVTSCNPYHGPFTGGQEVVIRGRGFDDGAVVYFGEHMVHDADTTVEDIHRITVMTPAGAPGPVDVRVVLGDEEAVKEDAYTYDIFHVTPDSGSIAGGTYVTITGSSETDFDPIAMVLFDGREAVEVDVVSGTSITCRTPQGTVGPANVTVTGSDPYEEYEVREAYTYYNHADPINGGLGGGPIDGTVNVTVLDYYTEEPIVAAFAILGISGDTSYQGLTDIHGQITFSGPDLTGRQSVTAAKEEYQTTTIEEFDAADVTIFLLRKPDPEPGPLPPGRYGAVVEGELVFSHAGEFGPGPWEIVPDPDDDEEKVAFTFGTGWSIWYAPPAPTLGGTTNETRDVSAHAGEYGYRFACFVRPGAVAVYSLAGLRNTTTGVFTPYAFGIARNIVAGPGEFISGIYIYMTHELNVPLRVRLDDPPPITFGSLTEPDTYKLDVFIDLGGDGVIFRENRTRIDKDGDLEYVFPGWLPLEAELNDATYVVKAGAYREDINDLTGMLEYTNPYSVRIESSITNIWEEVLIDEFLGIPRQVDPEYAAVVVDSRMEFEHERSAPDFWDVRLESYPDGVPLWRLILPGDMTSYTLPDLTLLAGLPEPPSGYSVWKVYGIEAPGFVYDEWSYRYLSRSYWSAYSADAFLFQFSID
ncbi:MAG: IPT/TIG domain-containing protein [Deltaproteobacteria bacterium]|nr:IPT/TIG domain-containing protein [Deltaproteobacteria bacterium]